MIVVDTNIVVEILEKRSRLPALLDYLRQNRDEEVAISTLTLSNVLYLLESHKVDVSTAEPLLRSYKIISVKAEDADWAFDHYKGTDFEDALQVAAARREACSAFVTIDKQLAKKYDAILPVKLIG
ncbi:MAG TPA: PIN domain-containing protein [Candidatus Saccharimonadales bacterium]